MSRYERAVHLEAPWHLSGIHDIPCVKCGKLTAGRVQRVPCCWSCYDQNRRENINA
jgi:hypothetical protein